MPPARKIYPMTNTGNNEVPEWLANAIFCRGIQPRQPRPAPTSLGGSHSRRALVNREEHPRNTYSASKKAACQTLCQTLFIRLFLSLRLDQKLNGGDRARPINIMKPKKATKTAKANPMKQNLLSGLGLVSMTTTKVS
jgi:hypothetical protein